MSENYSENEPNNEVQEESPKKNLDEKCWVKYLLIAFGAFLGAFLAVYFVVDMAVHRVLYSPASMFMGPPTFHSMMRHHERMMDDFMGQRHAHRFFEKSFLSDPVKVKANETDNSYVISIDLKPFEGNEKNITVNAKPNRISIEGKHDTKGKHTKKDVSFYQTFSLPEEINVNAIKKEKKNNTYVITLPFDED